MLNVYNILETIRMIQDECLDIRTITMGILTRRARRYMKKSFQRRGILLQSVSESKRNTAFR